MEKIVADELFDELALKDTKDLIAKAFNHLSADLRGRRIKKSMDEESMLMVRKKADELKVELSAFIDAQVTVIATANQLLRK